LPTANFELLVSGLDVKPMLLALENMPELWKECTIRQEYPNTCHADTENIFLRGPKTLTHNDYFFDYGSYDYPAMDRLGETLIPLVKPVFEKLQITEMGRMIIVKLKPHGIVKTHVDEGDYADHFSRFHICLQAEEGSTLTAYNESKHFSPGEAWWFNHKSVHFGTNDSDIPRIHIIFDAVTPLYSMKDLLEEEAQHKAMSQALGMGKVFM
jgi:hypothetical protein